MAGKEGTMPRKTKGFARLTLASAKRAADWAAEVLKLEDYEFLLWIQDDAPRWCGDVDGLTNGQSDTDILHKRARIWVSPSRFDADEDPLEVVMHEIAHVLFRDAGILRQNGDTHVHGVVHRTGAVLAIAYRAGV